MDALSADDTRTRKKRRPTPASARLRLQCRGTSTVPVEVSNTLCFNEAVEINEMLAFFGPHYVRPRGRLEQIGKSFYHRGIRGKIRP